MRVFLPHNRQTFHLECPPLPWALWLLGEAPVAVKLVLDEQINGFVFLMISKVTKQPEHIKIMEAFYELI